MQHIRHLALGLVTALGLAIAAAPAGAAILNGVQSGTQTLSGTLTTTAVTLPRAVDATRAFVVCSYRNDTDTPDRRATCELASDGTAVTIVQSVADNGTVVRWTVADFQSGVLVQRGSATFAAGETRPGGALVTLGTAVDLAKSFVVLGGDRVNSTSNTVDERFTVRARLTGTTSLELERLETGLSVIVPWQVVEMEGASVQRGTLCIGAAATCPGSDGQITATTLGTAVDTSKSFIVLSRMAGTSVGGIEALQVVGGDFTSFGPAVTGLQFARTQGSTTANQHVQIAWEVVTLSDGSAVRRGQSGSFGGFGSATSTVTSAAFTAVDLTRTVPFVSLAGGASGSTTNGTETNWTATLNATTFTFQRVTNSMAASMFGWQAVQFYRCDTNPLCSVSARGGSGQATVSWSPIYDAACTTPTCHALVLRGAGSVTNTPTNGATYTAGNTIGAATVVYSGTGASVPTSFTNTGLTNGTTYCYKVFYKTGAALTTYVNVSSSASCSASSEVSARPAAGGTLWSFALSGGAALSAPIPGSSGRVYASSGAQKVYGLDGSGAPLGTLLQTHAAVQGYVSWFPLSGTANETVVAADLAGYVYAIDAVTGAARWSRKLAADGFSAAVSVQIYDYSNAAWKTAYLNDHGYAGDVVFVATRNTSATLNQIFALRATDGTTLWTFTPATPMDKILGQPWVDYYDPGYRNRMYVASLSGSGGAQLSLRVISTIDGSEVPCAACAGIGDIETAPTLHWDGQTLYIVAKDGRVYAINAADLTLKWTYTGANGKRIKGYIWTDFEIAGRFYFVAEGATQDEIWAVDDLGASAVAVGTGEWPSNPVVPVAGGRLSQPMIGYSPLAYMWIGASDGKVYQLRLSDGQALTTAGAPQAAFTVGDGTKTVGDAAMEIDEATGNLVGIFVGTSAGAIHNLQIPLP